MIQVMQVKKTHLTLASSNNLVKTFDKRRATQQGIYIPQE